MGMQKIGHNPTQRPILLGISSTVVPISCANMPVEESCNAAKKPITLNYAND